MAMGSAISSCRRALRPGRWLAMSVVTEHLEQRGAAFEALAHRLASSVVRNGLDGGRTCHGKRWGVDDRADPSGP
jgi:hypothetical protein